MHLLSHFPLHNIRSVFRLLAAIAFCHAAEATQPASQDVCEARQSPSTASCPHTAAAPTQPAHKPQHGQQAQGTSTLYDSQLMLARYQLARSDFKQARLATLAAAAVATDPDQRTHAAALLEQIEAIRVLSTQVLLDEARQAKRRSDWARLRSAVAEARRYSPQNAEAEALYQWMQHRGIVRPFVTFVN